MGFLTNLIPLPWRIAGLVLIVLLTFGYGYMKGYMAGNDKVEAIKAQIEKERDQQALHTAQTIVQDKGKLSNVVQDFHSNLSAVNAYWLQHSKTTPVVPARPAVTQGTQSRQPDAVPSGPSQAEYDELQQACSITTAMFNACRDGWISQER